MKHKILYLVLLLTLSISIWAENASNVSVRQRNKDIIITYDLSRTSNVKLWMMSKAHYKFSRLNAVEGAIGKRVRAGKNLEIIWHPLEEKVNFIADGVQFKVEALGVYEYYALRRIDGGKSNMETFITADFAYSLSPQMSYGLTLGQTYRGYGWYFNVRSNFNFKSNDDNLVCIEGGYIDNTLPFYSGKSSTSICVFNAGFVMDILEVAKKSKRNRFNSFGFFLGGGYGWRTLLWETVDHKNIKYDPASYKGFCADFGVIGSIYGLTLKAGISTIRFKYYEFETGIGWMF